MKPHRALKRRGNDPGDLTLPLTILMKCLFKAKGNNGPRRALVQSRGQVVARRLRTYRELSIDRAPRRRQPTFRRHLFRSSDPENLHSSQKAEKFLVPMMFLERPKGSQRKPRPARVRMSCGRSCKFSFRANSCDDLIVTLLIRSVRKAIKAPRLRQKKRFLDCTACLHRISQLCTYVSASPMSMVDRASLPSSVVVARDPIGLIAGRRIVRVAKPRESPNSEVRSRREEGKLGRWLHPG